MKILFAVQGEGRGHMTQAIALNGLLRDAGHRVVAVAVGSSSRREVPDFFREAFDVPVRTLTSPNFVFRENRAISLTRTVLSVLRHLPRFRASLRRLDVMVRETQPDLIVNFFEPLAGIHRLLGRSSVPAVAVGHQFMLWHPDCARGSGHAFQRLGLRLFTALVGARSWKAALSFYQAPERPEKRLVVCPPLLRRQLLDLEPAPGDFLLVYLLNHGYAAAIREWHAAHPEVPIRCFYDRPGCPEEEKVDATLTFFRLHGTRFLEYMARCRGVVCTAGFESVCEAAYLDKPVMMVPVENHVEQGLNAVDAARSGLGLASADFNLSRLLDFERTPANAAFREWVDRAPGIFIGLLERAAGSPAAGATSEPRSVPAAST